MVLPANLPRLWVLLIDLTQGLLSALALIQPAFTLTSMDKFTYCLQGFHQKVMDPVGEDQFLVYLHSSWPQTVSCTLDMYLV